MVFCVLGGGRGQGCSAGALTAGLRGISSVSSWAPRQHSEPVPWDDDWTAAGGSQAGPAADGSGTWLQGKDLGQTGNAEGGCTGAVPSCARGPATGLLSPVPTARISREGTSPVGTVLRLVLGEACALSAADSEPASGQADELRLVGRAQG